MAVITHRVFWYCIDIIVSGHRCEGRMAVGIVWIVNLIAGVSFVPGTFPFVNNRKAHSITEFGVKEMERMSMVVQSAIYSAGESLVSI